MKCKPLYFKGTEGVVEITQWFEIKENVFRISTAAVENQTNFLLVLLLASALTRFQTHDMTVTHDVCIFNDCTDVYKYNQRFQELALLCVRMFPEESDTM
ncbi:hypothetical protein Tco_0475575 [Tanacetum coccineum]